MCAARRALDSRRAVSSIVRRGVPARRACARSAPIGCATPRPATMVRAGVPLPEIGQVLRHRSLQTTAIYAEGRPRPAARRRPAVAASGDVDERAGRPRRGLPAAAPGAGLQARAGHGRRAARSSSPTSRPPARRRSPVELAIAWARLPRGAQPDHVGAPARRGRAGSPATCTTIDPATEVPPAGCSPPARRRPTPVHLVTATRSADCCRRPRRCARRCGPRPTRRCSGCSPSPACGSARRSRLTATTSTSPTGCSPSAHAKFDRARLVPLHPSDHRGAARLRRTTRDRLCPRPGTRRVLHLHRRHRAATAAGVQATFAQHHHRARAAHRDRPPPAFMTCATASRCTR